MPETVQIRVDGRTVKARRGTTVAAALVGAGVWRFRTSVGGDARGPLCGMGTCFECRLTVDGLAHQRACLTLCRPGMEVLTGG